MSKIRYSVLLALLAIIYSVAEARYVGRIEFGNESTDTLKINDLLRRDRWSSSADIGSIIASLATSLEGTKYVAHTLEGPDEVLRINIDSLDCTTYVETVAALALTISDGRESWRDFADNLCNLRYRGGEIDGYVSRLHYNSDWLCDNRYRGNLRDVTDTLEPVDYVVKSISFMSNHRDKYPALADSVTYERIKGVEMGYRNHRFPYIKTNNLRKKGVVSGLRNGDLLSFTSTLKDLDTTHMGIVLMRDGVPYVIHASSSLGRVTVSEVPLADFVKRNQHWTGVRVFRLTPH